MAFDFDSGVGSGGSGLSESYETVNKNIKAYPYQIFYSGSVVSSIKYTTPSGDVDKTFAYTGDSLTSVTLSGATPGGISLTKTLSYTGDDLTSIGYS